MCTGADMQPAAHGGADNQDLGSRIDDLLSQGLTVRLPPDLAQTYRHEMRPTGVRTTLSWCLLTAGLNTTNIVFDIWMDPPHLLALDIALRLIISLTFVTAALLFYSRRLIRFEPLIAVTPCFVMLLLAGIMGLLSGDPALLERLITDTMVVVLSATIFLFIDIEYTCWLAGLSMLLMAGIIAASDIREVAVKAQIVYFYAGAEAAILYGRYMLNHYRVRLFLLNFRNDLRNAAAMRDNAILAREAFTDPLTSVANRRAFNVAISGLMDVRQHLRPASLCMIDLDHFKQLNDSVGHVQGDLALRAVAAEISAQLRGNTDLLARFGGDEFLLLLADTGPAEALQIAQRICAAIEWQERQRGITVSIGVASGMERPMTIEDLLKEADGALYRAKQAGRNRASL